MSHCYVCLVFICASWFTVVGMCAFRTCMRALSVPLMHRDGSPRGSGLATSRSVPRRGCSHCVPWRGCFRGHMFLQGDAGANHAATVMKSLKCPYGFLWYNTHSNHIERNAAGTTKATVRVVSSRNRSCWVHQDFVNTLTKFSPVSMCFPRRCVSARSECSVLHNNRPRKAPMENPACSNPCAAQPLT